MLHQYRLLKLQATFGKMAEVIPRLVPLLNSVSYRSYDQMFGHELAHAIEFVHRGQHQRLKLPNYGWPTDNFKHTTQSAIIECRVFALQYLLEEALEVDCLTDILSIDNVDVYFGSNSLVAWKNYEHHKMFNSECKAKERIQHQMKIYRPIFRNLLDETADYIVDKCADLA